MITTKYEPHGLKLCWNSVGVHSFSGLNNDELNIYVKDISGKAMIVQDLVISCPNNILQE